MPLADLAPATDQPGLVDAYVPLADCFDEMRTADGEVRPHWQYLLDALRTLGPAGIEERWREASRLIRDNGVTYNLHGDPQGISRPWELDLLPLVIRSEEWAELERGLIQRAELFNLILLDLYGPRDLIRLELLPAELIDGCAGYLIPCHGIEISGGQPLVHYAADLTRLPDGRWQVIGDRTQSPLGAGYALENRVVLSRVLPSLFRDSHVHRLAGFFRSMRRTLTRIAPQRGDDSRVVVLTPGPKNEAYFEHAYLANYLGYTLVQGGDLSVRDGALWLRTLGRLERIDAVLRRVDDIWCDPLELREDSLLGIPGLVQATRAGNVALANALGSGVLENDALMAFLPQLCQHLLGEELALPHVPTWWCGDAESRAQVLENLDHLIIKPLSASRGRPPLEPGAMGTEARKRLIAAIQSQPGEYVAQERVHPSTAPALIGQRLEPRPTVLRTFLIAEEESYAVMPGGLGRLALSQENLGVSSQLGGLGKDVWVLASEPERQESLMPAGDVLMTPAVVQESAVSSRVADNLFWIGRYAERAEGLVRLLRITIFKYAERSDFPLSQATSSCLRSLLEALTNQTQSLPGFVGAGAEERLRHPVPELLSLISDRTRPGSLPQTLQALGQAAYSVRDRMSADTWRVIGNIESLQASLAEHPPQQLSQALDELDPLVTALVAFSGLTLENMTHNEGWHFLEIGRRLERGSTVASLLLSTLVPVSSEQDETMVIEAVLGVTDSLITYRRRYRGGTRVGALLDLVFRDEGNPRALAYQIAMLQKLAVELPRGDLAVGRTLTDKLVLRSLTEIRLAEIDHLIQVDPDEMRRVALAKMLTDLSDGMAAVSDAITAQYFRHEEQPHSLLRRNEPALP
ncbi:circularly permuted type 2 ATP-grasp protein [Thiorhodococcus mannitoliphagus]|uniref:Circularly permuted type 2 ATP-grasp protein n=1 Tax=Thiorhodococcus mannitoliphagus TaxID=329406 RepID=A0A6P1DZY8_9GAMM|nr:circularly permuted type 2 ATP-grasp protein [Thiorhodococcus mannitoliphagus]NEX23269.1 circularly permuted type 2 ATP-grasp protein [Thiorhodococcus mannitoliphagus]